MRDSLWYHPLGPRLRTAFSAKQCRNQAPPAIPALSISTPWKESKTEPPPTNSHSVVRGSRILSCTYRIREARFHLYPMQFSTKGDKKYEPDS